MNRIKVWVYTLGGALAGVAGLLVTARLDSATPNAGLGYELDSIAAVVIGGTSLSGGRGSVLGTALGCLIIGVLDNGLVLLDVNAFWQQVIKGTVILVAVIIDMAGNKSETAWIGRLKIVEPSALRELTHCRRSQTLISDGPRFPQTNTGSTGL